MKINKIRLRIILFLLVLGTVFALWILQDKKEFDEGRIEGIERGSFQAKASVHDPSVIKGEDGKYYIFGSHMAAAWTSDLREFTSFAAGVSELNPLFANLFTDYAAFSYVGKNEEGGYSVWAPDVIYNKAMKKYVMYFCTTSSYIKSNLCYATADQIQGPYTYQGTFLYSGFNADTIKETNVFDYVSEEKVSRYFSNGGYNNQKWPNALDPSVFYDQEGRMWMVYGSWSGGMYILEIEEETGLPIHPETDAEQDLDAYFGQWLIGGAHKSVEAPYILYDEQSKYYYLFVSYGGLQAKGGYQIRLYRSKAPNGPYEDAAGKDYSVYSHTNHGVKLMGNYNFPSLANAYMAPGHNSAMIDEDGKWFLVYHTRFANRGEAHEPRVHQMVMTEKGWPVALPFAYAGEESVQDAFREEEILGNYFIVNHMLDMSSTIHEPVLLHLEKDGIILDEFGNPYEGSYSISKKGPYLSITLGKYQFDAVITPMEDELGNPVLTFSGVSENNMTLWGVKYLNPTEKE